MRASLEKRQQYQCVLVRQGQTLSDLVRHSQNYEKKIKLSAPQILMTPESGAIVLNKKKKEYCP